MCTEYVPLMIMFYTAQKPCYGAGHSRKLKGISRRVSEVGDVDEVSVTHMVTRHLAHAHGRVDRKMCIFQGGNPPGLRLWLVVGVTTRPNTGHKGLVCPVSLWYGKIMLYTTGGDMKDWVW